MTDRLDRISRALSLAEVGHECAHDRILMQLPDGFGALEVKVWPDGSDSIQLVGGDFHTHTDLLALEFGQDADVVFATLALKVKRREFLLIEETAPDGSKRRTIEDSMEDYLRYLPDGFTYRVAGVA